MAASLELNRQILGRELTSQRRQSGLLSRLKLPAFRRLPSKGPRGFRRLRWQQFAVAVVALAFIAARWQWSGSRAEGDLPEGRYEVAKVLGADRLELTNGVEVRLLGVAAFQHSSEEDVANSDGDQRAVAALDFTRQFVGGGKVRLQFDRTRLDPDGRYLAYVWVDDSRGSRLLNEELLRSGLVRAAPKSLALCSSSMKRRLMKAADGARGVIRRP